jgi:hypothetical protein
MTELGVFVTSVNVLTVLFEPYGIKRLVVEPVNVPPGAAPFIVPTLRLIVERVWKRPVPATSRVVAGVAVPIPTFDEEPAM